MKKEASSACAARRNVGFNALHPGTIDSELQRDPCDAGNKQPP
jgi:hypothetical protein